MDFLVFVVFFALVAAFVIRAWKARGKLCGRDRWALITGFITAITGFAIAALLINWTVIPVGIWLVAIGLLASGVVGAVLRWPELHWFAEGAKPTRRIKGAIANLCICALIIGVAYPLGQALAI
jgi:hypothetical protein